MITYYRDDSVEVTSHAIQVDGRAYPLREMATVYHRAGGRELTGWRTLGSRIAMGFAPLALLVASLVLVLLALRIDAGLVAKMILFVIAAGLALATLPLLDLSLGGVERTYDRGTRVHEIWARWRGTEVMLVRTGDKTRFGRIYRALQRAVEQH